MSRINIDSLVETSQINQNKQEVARMKYIFRTKGLIPIVEDNKLSIYKVTANSNLSKLIEEYKNNMMDKYDEVLQYDKYEKEYKKAEYYNLPFYTDMLSHRQSTPEELFKYFNMDKSENEKESLQDKVRDYVTCTFKRDSKLAKIIKHIGYEQIDLDYIASIVYDFLYSIKIDFSTGVSILAGTRIDLEKMPFTNKEKELSEDEKMSTIIKIISAFDIECVYIEELNKISDFLLGCIFGEISREDAINFSEHNYDILNNSEFSPIYRKIKSLNQKKLIKDKN